ncbi:hypothetical protein CR155_15845 [Pollutimonas nitritireducens]|uniref:Uncharacterized protein n=1 Tax=Pollutimonas nitritireducens TaxID=2045209 RepID=A0A2N4UCX7_9BURK|nr:hypothetical protein [Pollutimonas nitritireducens]PLC52878.1 hypothetical protein CR155_15845 [Pollutimonas nitritireducens]
MIGSRTRYSLAQFLSLQEVSVSIALFGKYNVQHLSLYPQQLLTSLTNVVRDLDDRAILLILQEVVATEGNLRAPVSPKYRFTERMHDLTQCLLLDGYLIQDKRLLQTDPSIADAASVEDDLIIALRNSGAPQREAIITKINDSAEAFRSVPPDYNAALTNARVALETLAVDVASDVVSQRQVTATYDPTKWGQVILFLRQSGEISLEEERGLAGVFGFLSPGAHRPVGIPESQMARLGRSFALNMCWFLLQNRLAQRSP